MSYEAVFYVRKLGALGAFERKWLTVPTDDTARAIEAFHALGYETRGGTILSQEQATAQAKRLIDEGKL